MFTGIVEEVGTVAALERHDGHARLEVTGPLVVGDAAIGDSIAVDGCCLTVTTFVVRDGRRVGFVADLMAETLRATALGDLEGGTGVNLERAMRADTRFGGHLVQGHVDGVGEVLARDERPGTVFVDVRAPEAVRPYLVAKGSVTLAGVSLTVVSVDGDGFRVGLIPHTLEATTFGAGLHPGRRVNLEADVVAKYVQRLLTAGVDSPYTSLASEVGHA
ncbi:riboflavin synthase [Egicoccus halophilus]|uniref:Riboflavin synthase n=1 Tax=Egicoccus halophilus TaxID=1670830 RepID=A0A8J3A9C6_9ACTN|nr:riboflavin synthase [Egicoccus halophilus]GGI07460.1 riboflavin synthase subunit alpha [Egicoccus halophilus]